MDFGLSEELVMLREAKYLAGELAEEDSLEREE
jgi:hypothetical protein